MRHDRIDDDLPGFNPQAKQLRNNQADKNARPAGVHPPSAPERELASLDFIVTFIGLITVAEGNIGAAVIAIRLADIPAGDNVPVSHRDGLAERFQEGIRPAGTGLGFSVWMTSRAAFQTSASTQPPPMVPVMDPSSRTRSLALSQLGMEPRT